MGYFFDLLQNKKKLTVETLKTFHVGIIEDQCLHSFDFPDELVSYITTEQVILPFYSLYNQLLGCIFRVNRKPKYLSPVENKRDHLYGLHLTARDILEKNSIILVEGSFDMMAMYQNGFKNVVALCDVNLSHSRLCLLRRFCTKVYTLLDADIRGQEACKLISQTVQNEGMNYKNILLPNGLDPDDYLAMYGEEAVTFIREELY